MRRLGTEPAPQVEPRTTTTPLHQFEPFVDEIKASEFLTLTVRELLAKVRAGKLPGHPVDPSAKRRKWRFRLSELAIAMCARQATIAPSSPLAPTRR
jgi:hypothetical protein